MRVPYCHIKKPTRDTSIVIGIAAAARKQQPRYEFIKAPEATNDNHEHTIVQQKTTQEKENINAI